MPRPPRPLCAQLTAARQPRPGVDQGPIHLIEAGLPRQLEELGWEVHFDGHHQFEAISASIASDPPIGKLKNPRTVSKVCEAVAKVVGKHAREGVLPLTLGGDHSLVRELLFGTDFFGVNEMPSGYGNRLWHA